MNSALPPNVVARYKPDTGGLIPVILISGLFILGIIGYRMLGQSSEERLVTLAMLCLLFAGTVVSVVIFSSIRIHTIEITSSGTMDFVSRVKRETHPRNNLLRIEGITTRSSKGASSHRARFVFAGEDQNESIKEVLVPIMPDPALQEFVRQIEKSNPKADTSKFWAWMNQ